MGNFSGVCQTVNFLWLKKNSNLFISEIFFCIYILLIKNILNKLLYYNFNDFAVKINSGYDSFSNFFRSKPIESQNVAIFWVIIVFLILKITKFKKDMMLALGIGIFRLRIRVNFNNNIKHFLKDSILMILLQYVKK